MTPEEQKEQLLTDIKTKVGEELNKRGYTSKTEVDGVINKALEGLDLEGLRAYKTDKDAIELQVRNVATELQKLKDNGIGEEKKDMSIRGQVRAWQEANKEAIAKIKEGQKADLPVMALRVPITMTIGASLGASAFLPNAQVAPGINDLNRAQPTFWELIPKGRTSANPYVWVNKTNKQGNATFIGEGVLKNLASFELSSESSVPKKVAERMKASTEILYDVEGMTTLIEDELRFEVLTAANTAVLTGTASSTVPAGITTLAAAYTLTTIKTANPTESDAIRAAIAQLYNLNFRRNIVAVINPIDAANMDLAKADTSGVYMLPPFTTADGRRIAGVPVVEDPSIAVGNLLIGDLSKYRILMYQDFHVMWGWENDDFSKNLVTVIGEMRFHQFMGANDAGAFIYDAFADIKTALTPAP